MELKNGDSYSGTLVAVDNFMNIRLEVGPLQELEMCQDAIFTPRLEHKFEHMQECTIRGQFAAVSALFLEPSLGSEVKFIRFPDDILDRRCTESRFLGCLRHLGHARGGTRQERSGEGERSKAFRSQQDAHRAFFPDWSHHWPRGRDHQEVLHGLGRKDRGWPQCSQPQKALRRCPKIRSTPRKIGRGSMFTVFIYT